MFKRTLTTSSLLLVSQLALLAQVSVAQKADAPVAAARPANTTDAVFGLLLETRFPPKFDQPGDMRRLEKALPLPADMPARGALEEQILARWNSLRSAQESNDFAWLEQLEAGKKLSGLGTLEARSLLASWHRQNGRYEQASALREGDGWLRHGLAIGPFGDEGSTYFGATYGPEFGKFEFQGDHEGRYGKIRWRKVKIPLSSTQLDAGQNLPSDKREGCHYMLIQIEAGQSQKAWIDALCSGSYELFWNESRVANVRRGIDWEGTRSFRPIVLRKGWNQLLVKTTSTRQRTIALRLLDTEGRTIPGLTLEKEMLLHAIAPEQPQTLEMPPPLSLEETFAMQHQEGRWAQVDGQPVSPMMLAYMGYHLAGHGRPDLGLSMCREALARDGKHPGIRAAHLDSLRLARHIPYDMRRLEIRRAIKDAGSLDESHAWFLTQKVDRLFQDDKREEALRLVRAHEAKDPTKYELVALEYSILRNWKWNEEAERVLDRMLEMRPGSSRLILDKANRIERRGDLARARKMVTEALASQPGERNLLTRATRLARLMGDYATREKLLARSHREQPESREAYESMAWLAEDQGQYEKAADLLKLAAAKAPGVSRLQEDIGDALYLAGKKDAALAAYEKSLAAEPSDHAVRRWIYRQKGLQDEFPEAGPFQIDGMKVAMNYKERPEDKTSSSSLLIDQMILRVNRDGSMIEETHQLRRINDRSGVEAHEEAKEAAAAEQVLLLRTIDPEGKTYVPHLVSNNFSMPKLEPGCFIEERYRNFKSGRGAQPIDFVRFYFRSTDEPYLLSQLVVLMPKGQELGHWSMRNFPKEDITTKDMGDHVAWIFERKDVPRLVQERQMPQIEELVPWVTFGEGIPMAPFVRSMKAAFDSLAYPFLEIREKTAEVTKGIEGDYAKAKAIHDFVHSWTPDAALRRGSPLAMSVLLKKEGDRFGLQLAMLRAAGIDYTPALIWPQRPELQSADLAPFPEPGVYRTRAVVVHPKDADSFWIIQDSYRYWPMGKLPPVLGGSPTAGCPYILLEGESGFPGILPGPAPTETATIAIEGKLRFDGTKAILEADLHFRGPNAYILKEDLKARTSNIRKQFAEQQVAQGQFPGFRVKSSRYIDLDVKGKPFSIHFTLERPDAIRKRGDEHFLLPVLPPNSMTRRLGGRAERVQDFVVKAYQVTQWDLTIDPGTWRFGQLPESLLVRKDLFDYGLSYEIVGRQLRVRRLAMIQPARIKPRDYPAFLELCRQIDDAEASPIPLRD